MKTVLITGADGFLGSHLVDFCISRNYKIYALIRDIRKMNNLSYYIKEDFNFSEDQKLNFLNNNIQIPTKNEKVVIIECDIKNRILIENILKETKPNYIFHFAAQPHVIPSWEDPINTIETNVVGTLNIFEPLKKFKIKSRVIVACSSAEYGTTTEIKRPLKESDPLMAIHPYGISKIAAELLSRQYCINFNIEIINLRFFNQTGPKKEGDACSDFIKRVAKIELGITDPLIEVGNLNPYRDITGINDSIQAIWLAATEGIPGETYNVCSNMKVQIRDVLKIALSFSSKKIRVIENTPKKLRETDEDIIVGNNTKLKKLGFKLTQSLQDILKEMFDYWIEIYKKDI